MRAKKGSVLVMTVGFMFIFTLLGYGVMSYSGFQGQGITMKTSSTQGFWLAEAGVQRALSFLGPPNARFSGSKGLGGGSYTVTTQLKPGYHNRWIIDSTGFKTPVTKKIQVEVAPNVINAFQTTGTVGFKGGGTINGTYTEHDHSFTFEGTFGTSTTTMKNFPGVQIMTGNQKNPGQADNGIALHDGIIWVDGDLRVTNNSSGWSGYAGILIVNGSLEMEGGTFDGIVWVNGPAGKISGNPGISGAVFVNDPSNGETSIRGTSGITYGSIDIDNAYDKLLSSIDPNHPPANFYAAFRHILRWEEKQ